MIVNRYDYEVWQNDVYVISCPHFHPWSLWKIKKIYSPYPYSKLDIFLMFSCPLKIIIVLQQYIYRYFKLNLE